MTNTDAWDRIAARRGAATPVDSVRYGPDLPTEAALRLCGDVGGKRVLDLGCGAGENAVVLARKGAHVIAVDASIAQLALGRMLAEAHEARVEWHEGDVADLAFLRADSIDLVLATGVLGEIEDIDRLFRQVHRVLRPGAPFVFSYEHPMALALGRDVAGRGALPPGAPEVLRPYFDSAPVKVERDGEQLTLWPRTIAAVFAALHRAGYRVDNLLEPEPLRSADPAPSISTGSSIPTVPSIPTVIVWRARKEGV